MPQLANLTIRGAGAVDHVFKPRDIVGGVATLVKSTGVPLADRVATVSTTRTPSGAVKVVAKLKIPIVQDMTVNGVTKPTVVRTMYGTITFTADAASTSDERIDILEQTGSLMGSDPCVKAFQDLEFFW